MSTYGRNFEFRVPPHGTNRAGRFCVPSTGTRIPIGAPVKADTGAGLNTLSLQTVALATGAQAPVKGLSGIAVYEYGPAAFAGDDPFLTTYSDKEDVPLAAAIQVVSGLDVKVVFRNTASSTFLNTRSYTGRTFVAGVGATPTVAVGDFLTPGDGNTTTGFWKKDASATNAWLVITKVDSARDEVEARMLF